MKRLPLPSCPLCSAGPNPVLREVDCRAHPLWRAPLPFLIPWRKCTECKHVYADPLDKDAEALLFRHPAHGYQDPLMITAEQKTEQRFRAWDLLHRMRDHFPEGPWWKFTRHGPAAPSRWMGTFRWLDIGAGSGALCRTLQELGHDAAAVEIRSAAVQNLRELGVPAFVPSEPLDDHWDVVSMGDVLEHVEDMRALLRRAMACVDKGAGILWISMPNCDSWVLQDMGEDDPNWYELEHLHRPTRKRMLTLFAELGLEVRAVDVSSFYLGALEYFLKVPKYTDFGILKK